MYLSTDTELIPQPSMLLSHHEHPSTLGHVAVGSPRSCFSLWGCEADAPQLLSQPAQREKGCSSKELLCCGSCGLRKTLWYLICNQQFPGLSASGRETLGFISRSPWRCSNQTCAGCLLFLCPPKETNQSALKALPCGSALHPPSVPRHCSGHPQPLWNGVKEGCGGLMVP